MYVQLSSFGGSYLRNCFCLTWCEVLIRNQNILSIWASQRTKESSAVYDNITEFVTPWKKWAQLIRIRGKHFVASFMRGKEKCGMCIQHSHFQGLAEGLVFPAWLRALVELAYLGHLGIFSKRISDFRQHQRTCGTIDDTRGTKTLQAPGKSLQISNWQPQERFERLPESLAMLVRWRAFLYKARL